MNLPNDIRYSDQLLKEAMEMLERMHPKLGLFERQYYTKLKQRVDQHISIQLELRTALNCIPTRDSDA